MKSLIIAEKPELAKSILCAIDGKEEKKDGYFQKGNYIVTWAYGHIMRLQTPEEYDKTNKNWEMKQLPIYFKDWKKVPIEKTKKQFNVIKKLIKESNEIINAGDIDEEGQLLIDEIIKYCGFKGTVKRIQTSAFNEEYLRKALKRLEPNSKYESWGESANAREIADYMVGINLSRYFSILNNRTLSIGRVQTPTLGLVVNRDIAIEKHIKEKYYEGYIDINIDGNIVKAKLESKQNEAYKEQEELRKILDKFLNKTIKLNITKQIKNENAPLPFNLTKLQSHISKKYKIKPDETLKITQDLREKYHAITYNRSDSQYLNEEHYKEAPEVIKQVFKNINIQLDLDFNNLSKSKCFDDSKVTAHHGIIPTIIDLKISDMNDKEQKIYKEICIFYLIQFLPPLKKEITSLQSEEMEDYKFKANSTRVLDEGYREFLRNDNDENSINILSKMKEGNYKGIINSKEIKEIETKPLSRYTQASLIEDMTRISKYVDDSNIKEVLKRKDKDKEGENGSIGTSATRSNIIQNLIKRGYIKEEKDKVISTELGREYYKILPDEWKKADLTAKWWLIQEKIKEGKANQDKLLDSILIDIKEILKTEDVSKFKLQNNYNDQKTPLGKCPICNKEIYEGEKSYYCSGYKDGCKFTILKKIAGKKITNTNVTQLLTRGITTQIKGFKSKNGKTFNAKLKLVNETITFEF
ncbi:type IA DNA topoisomerase [uncultured Clostridium sp.]|jgi:DNA topoisomerase-3|uniref:type IA DNA topoisomerase n=1 Tax=uncultured Clostridium sp. TaxID=59620 RepID=UPI002729BC4F|nr:type IA DNA topoisomerase [uncultured Clostridium sp.]